MNAQIQTTFGPSVTLEAADVNGDGNTDVGEYATGILLSDMLSEDANNLTSSNITGEINNQGENASLTYCIDKNSLWQNKHLMQFTKGRT